MLSVTRFVQEIAAKIWPLVAARTHLGWQWLIAPRDPVTWTDLRAKFTKLQRTYAGRLAVLGAILLLLLIVLLFVLPWYAHKDEKGTYPNAALINPILGGLGALFLIYAAIRQAQIAAKRHAAQTRADLQRRITESFSKAIEQLSSDKLEVQLGGIYALERISCENLDDYWTVIMETLSAFVRERAKRAEPASRPPTNIAAALNVIIRRSPKESSRENMWLIDLSGANLRGANLVSSAVSRRRREEQKEGPQGANLITANLSNTHLEGAELLEANLTAADLQGAYLQKADMRRAILTGADLTGARLEGAKLRGACLQRTRLSGAHLESTDLSWVRGLEELYLCEAIGDAKTRLPNGVARPRHWPPYEPNPTDSS